MKHIDSFYLRSPFSKVQYSLILLKNEESGVIVLNDPWYGKKKSEGCMVKQNAEADNEARSWKIRS